MPVMIDNQPNIIYIYVQKRQNLPKNWLFWYILFILGVWAFWLWYSD